MVCPIPQGDHNKYNVQHMNDNDTYNTQQYVIHSKLQLPVPPSPLLIQEQRYAWKLPQQHRLNVNNIINTLLLQSVELSSFSSKELQNVACNFET